VVSAAPAPPEEPPPLPPCCGVFVVAVVVGGGVDVRTSSTTPITRVGPFRVILHSRHQLMTASMVRVTNLTPPGSDNPTDDDRARGFVPGGDHAVDRGDLVQDVAAQVDPFETKY
jgi:hypothetical protein